MDSQDKILVEKIYEIYDNISSLESTLKPSKDVDNKLFAQSVLIHPIDVTKLCNKTQEIRSKLIRLCGEADVLLENYVIVAGNKFPMPAAGEKKILRCSNCSNQILDFNRLQTGNASAIGKQYFDIEEQAMTA